MDASSNGWTLEQWRDGCHHAEAEAKRLREAVKVRDEHIEALLRECAAGRNPTRALHLLGNALITLGKALKTVSDE